MSILRYNQTLFIALIAMFISVPSAHAAEAINVSLTPLVYEVTVKPGTSTSGSLEVQNLSDAAQTLYPIARDFEPDPDSGGSPRFLPKPSDTDPTFLSNWVTFSQASMTLAPKETKVLTYQLSVPDNASPGGHYGAVFASAAPPAQLVESGVSLGGSVGTLLLVTVEGTVTVAGSGGALRAVDNQGKSWWIYQSLPLDLQYTLHNSGTVHLTPSGALIVRRGKTTVLERTLNPDNGRVLPASDRMFTERITDAIGYGRFTATATVTMTAPNGETVPATLITSFWRLPLTPIGIALLLLIALFIGFRIWLKHHDAAIHASPKHR